MTHLFRVAMAAIALILTSQASAWAQAATHNINLDATVADFCSIAGTVGGGSDSRTITVSSGTVDTAALAQVSVLDVACSRISDLELSSSNTGLTGPGALGGFQNVIHYVAVASFDGAAPSLDTSVANTATDATTGAATGTLTVDITPVANTLPMAPGGYADVLVVTLTPQ